MRRGIVGALLAVALAAGPSTAADTKPAKPTATNAAVAPESVVNEASLLYDQSRFDEAIKLVSDAIKAGKLPAGDLNAAREILARCQVKTGRRLEARDTFKSILRTDPAYRPDAVRTPPDEMEVFQQAYQDFQKEMVERGQRIPTSIGGFGGIGFSSNKDYSEIAEAGGAEKMNGGPEFGGSVRFPVRPKLQIDLELSRLSDSAKDTNDFEYDIEALPLVASAVWTAKSSPKFRLNLIAGLGALLAAESKVTLQFFTVPIQISGSKTGFYLHGGVEGEYLVHPRISVTGRALGRYAKANDLDWGGAGNIDLNGHDPHGKSVDFSGMALQLGFRAYVGS